MINMDEIIKEQLQSISDISTDDLIDKLDVDEYTVDHLRYAIKAWIKSDLGKRETKTQTRFSRKSARVTGRIW